MVNYCAGNFCKKKRRNRTRYIYNKNPQVGVSTKSKELVDPNKIVVTNAPTAVQGTFKKWTPFEDSQMVTAADLILSGLPTYKFGKALFEGFRDNDPWKIATTVGEKAYDAATALVPGLAIGSLAKQGLKQFPVGKSALRFGKILGNALLGEGRQLGKKALDGITKSSLYTGLKGLYDLKTIPRRFHTGDTPVHYKGNLISHNQRFMDPDIEYFNSPPKVNPFWKDSAANLQLREQIMGKKPFSPVSVYDAIGKPSKSGMFFRTGSGPNTPIKQFSRFQMDRMDSSVAKKLDFSRPQFRHRKPNLELGPHATIPGSNKGKNPL